MKKLILISLCLITLTSFGQLKDLTAGGVKNAVSTTYYYYDAVSTIGKPFALHCFQWHRDGTNVDTVVFQVQVSNTTVGNGAWENLGSAITCKPADTSAIMRDTLWFKRLRVKAVTSATSNDSYHYAIINYQK